LSSAISTACCACNDATAEPSSIWSAVLARCSAPITLLLSCSSMAASRSWRAIVSHSVRTTLMSIGVFDGGR
jgi:hypothetical protein